ncbi:hypothetical protein [Aeromicrobium sp. 179-A 4D2 NHS]|uniref:hypothetical protein n=1 Tax=Aeromicrobium sp. 179-A 4D2 NHS TaxID=3142375 RepID=UPI00399FD066
MRGLVTAACAAVLLLGACGEKQDDSDPLAQHPELLQRADLPEAEDVEVSDQTNVSKTNCAAMDSEWNLAASDDFVYASFRLADGDSVVRSAVQGPPTGSDSIDVTFDRLTSMIDECVADERSSGSFERLDGLPDGAVGFRAVQETSNGPQTTERAYAPAGDERAVVVTVVHTGDGEPAADVASLLPKALERAEG